MIDVEIERAEPATVAFIQMSGVYDQVPDGFRTLYSWIEARGLMADGAPRAVYLTPPDSGPADHATWELQAMVASGTPPIGPNNEGLGVRRVPEAIYATTLYKGPYEGIEPAYEELAGWIGRHGYEMAGPPEELYLTGPRDTGPEDYVTRIRFPVRET